MSDRRQYTEDDKAAALAMLVANGGNVTRTANELGIPASTLAKWRDGKGISSAVPEKCEQKKEALGDLWERIIRLYGEHALHKDAIKKTSGKDAVMAAAIATDKWQLLNGKPTTISGSSLTDEQRNAELRRMAERIRSRRAGAADPGRACPLPSTN